MYNNNVHVINSPLLYLVQYLVYLHRYFSLHCSFSRYRFIMNNGYDYNLSDSFHLLLGKSESQSECACQMILYRYWHNIQLFIMIAFHRN